MSSRSGLFLSAFMAAGVWMSRLAFSSVAPLIKDQFKLTYAQLGLPPAVAVAFATAGYAASGFLTYRFGTRKILLYQSLASLALSDHFLQVK